MDRIVETLGQGVSDGHCNSRLAHSHRSDNAHEAMGLQERGYLGNGLLSADHPRELEREVCVPCGPCRRAEYGWPGLDSLSSLDRRTGNVGDVPRAIPTVAQGF